MGAKFGSRKKTVFNRLKERYVFSYLRHLLGSFKKVRTLEGESGILAILNELQNHKIPISYPLLRWMLPKKVRPIFEINLRQKLLRDLLETGLSSAIMLSRGGSNFKTILPVPQSWQIFLEKNSVFLNKFSSIYFVYYIFLKFREGLSEIFELLCRYEKSPASAEAAVLIGFPPAAVAILSNEKIKLRNFISWVREKFNQKEYWIIGQEQRKISDTVLESRYPFPSLNRLKKIKFVMRSLFLTVKVMIAGILGQWTLLYLFKELVDYYYVECLQAEDLPSLFIFSNSCYIYRPLWTHLAEERGSEIRLLFYATNTYNVKLAIGDYGLMPGYGIMTWPIYHTFHQNHAKFLEEILQAKVKIYVEESPIPLEDSEDKLEMPECKKIALFDVQPFKESFMAKIGRPTSLYTFAISKTIFEDLQAWCQENNILLIIKPKRGVGKRLCPKYFRMLKQLRLLSYVKIAYSQCSPERICEQVDAVICQPFTSAALFASAKRIPVAYYDPTHIFLKEQPACQGVPVLQGKVELNDWLSRVMQ